MIEVKNAVFRHPDIRFREPVSFAIGKDEQVAIVGPNGAGKSVLAQMLTGKYPLREGGIVYDESLLPVYEKVKLIAFKDSYGPADAAYYLQQRWNSQDRDESPLVRDRLGDLQPEEMNRQLLSLFDVDEMLDKQLVLLSSGEMRKLQLTKTLLTHPRLLIIDNPFIGLDTDARKQLCDVVEALIRSKILQVVFLLAKVDEIPDFITHIIPVRNRICSAKIKREVFCAADFYATDSEMPVVGDLQPPFMSATAGTDAFITENHREAMPLPLASRQTEPLIEMQNVTIRYGERVILDALNWTVRRGEKWAVLGPNGSGKSTLLSLICADNPQGYACDISLFGCRRGSGESIWDIKKRIGYVSPEMHRSYVANIPAIDIVISGLHDSVGLYVRPRPEQYGVCEWWMRVFGVSDLRDRPFLQLSDGEQRMILLVRAFVKDPELLILDEPMHGLDTRNRLLVRIIIESFCRRPGKTLLMVTHYEQELPACVDKRKILPGR